MIPLQDITVIIQGAIYQKYTQTAIASARKHLPGASVILSSCDVAIPSSISGYDNLILSPDPGSFPYPHCPEKRPNNINRQLVNTYAALRQVQTLYTLKMRTDFMLTGHDFLNYFDLYNGSIKKWRIFQHKLLACCYFTRNAQSHLPYPFHLADIAFFGRTEDLKKLYDIPLMTREEAYWNSQDKFQYRYTPEQHLFISCLRKHSYTADCEFYNDCRSENIEQTERYLASNFILLNYEQFCLASDKKTFLPEWNPKDFLSCYTHHEWKQLYKKHIDHSLILQAVDIEKNHLLTIYKRYKKYNLFINIIAMPFFWNKKLRHRIRNYMRTTIFNHGLIHN